MTIVCYDYDGIEKDLDFGTYIATWAEDVKKYITYQMGVFQ